MPITKARPVWPQRLARIRSRVENIRLPSLKQAQISQDAEWCDVVVDGQPRRVRFHDYDEIFAVPGLYEELFYQNLRCCSPSRVAHLLDDLLDDFGTDPAQLRVLDVGAGNGMVADELHERGAGKIVGIDIIPEARQAALRDRPGVYADYLVADLTRLTADQLQMLREHRFNCLVTVAALGFGDIPPAAFLQAMDLVESPGWLCFTIKEDFLHEDDTSGFARTIRRLNQARIIQTQALRRFRHRYSVTGQPLYYVISVARKLKPLPPRLLEESLAEQGSAATPRQAAIRTSSATESVGGA